MNSHPVRPFFVSATLAAGIACLLLARPVAAQAPSAPNGKPNVILFVGNSFTHGHYKPVRDYNAAAVTDENMGLPKGDPRGANRVEGPGAYVGIGGIFKKMTDEAGLNYEVHVETVGGTNLEYHYKHALPLIAQARWNTVVMHDYSTGPLPESRNKAVSPAAPVGDESAGSGKDKVKPEGAIRPNQAMATSFYQHVPLLEKAIHAANPQAKVYLYATWPTALVVYPPGSMYSGEKIDAMGKELHDAYYRAANDDGHITGIAPVGDAWMRAIHEGVAVENPYATPLDAAKLDLWGADHKHPSSAGSYLAALVLFEELTGKDARSLGKAEQAAADLKISPETAARLQQVAHEQMTTKPDAALAK